MSVGKACAVIGCESASRARSMCKLHYDRVMRIGTTEVSRPKYSSPEEAFEARTRLVESGCIEWTGAKIRSGYGTLWSGGRSVKAHRYAWERANGPIPEGMLIDHKCWNKLCVNVKHLRVVTNGQNQQNLEGPRAGSSSGIRGVYFHKPSQKWQAQIQVGGVPYYGGLHSTREEAAQVAVDLRAKHMTHSQN